MTDESEHIAALGRAGYVVLRRKSHEHTLRELDRARNLLDWEKQASESVRVWAHRALDEQERLSARLNAVCYAATSLGVPIEAINAALVLPPGKQTGVDQ